MNKFLTWLIALLVPTAMALGLVVSAPAQASTITPGCVSGLGKNVPVVLVHGLLGSSKDWTDGSPSMVDALSRVPGITVVRPIFNYARYNKDWVDNPNIGPKLAHLIACVATSSREAGGPGKVIVIAHSMGGLAVRWAATEASNAKEVTSDLGMVFTLGTPSLGSGWANQGVKLLKALCSPNTLYGNQPQASYGSFCASWSALYGLQDMSSQIKALPPMPNTVPVYAVAGDVTLTVPLYQATFSVNTGSDLVVSEKSALHGTTNTGESGEVAESCDQSINLLDPALSVLSPAAAAIHQSLHGVTGLTCWHSALPHNTGAEQAITSAIGNYLLTLTSAPCSAKALFAAAVAKEHFNPNSPGYKSLPVGNKAGAYGATCAGQWAIAAISHPYTGTTDSMTLFHVVSGHWVEVANLGGEPADCQLADAGVPPSLDSTLLPNPASDTGQCS